MNLFWHPHALFIVLFLLFGLITALVNYFTVRRFDQYPQARKFPRVSVLVPARNEERNIEACVASLLAQDYPDFEVIVLDDHSTDGTRRILNRLLESAPRLKVQTGAPLPEGWLGKHWACHQLHQSATGDLLLFTDADTRHSIDMLRASVSALFAEHADLVTAFPREEVVTWGEKLLVPFIGFGILTFIPVRLVQRLRWTALSVTIGQFMLFRRLAFEAIGGFEAVRAEIVDDMCLGRNIIAGGFEWRLLDGTQHISCRMYQGFWEAVNGFGKSIFAVFDYRILPYLFGWLAVGMAFLEPATALISRWLHYPLTPLAPEPASLAVALSLLLWAAAYRRFKFPAYMVLFYPFTMLLFLLVALRSFVQTATGTATWKDREIERVAMRWL
ncbi:MAG: glycosyltransferase [Chloroflexi bacterium]|nr:glycosyltransferase [Chloroflexota bacterium]